MPARSEQLEATLSNFESDHALLDPSQFARRFAVEEELERLFGDKVSESEYTRALSRRARALQLALEKIDSQLFADLRSQIRSGICPAEFRACIHNQSSSATGLDFDHLDDLVSGVLRFEPPPEEPRTLSPDSVFYQPTPARHIFRLISAAAITEADTLIDLGSGLGHVPLLVSICTGATSIGIELDPALIASAEQCAAALSLRNITFRAQDAREADLSAGTVFYLYTPFTGATLASVLNSLRTQAGLRPIRICTFGPCTSTLTEQPWLRPSSPPTTDQITVFTPLS
ncbi:class I SAM-dependent methyltransferase [Occallatibacter savannae]|uniref:class I SAM-dependent methyltransferase n=1 Tax=Occallatibacter savannae TaxID=1002691 RepID=UPI000D69E0F7|nr:class I SAM-dependent methyltransferase [Occallatibacter savannae]